MGDTRFGDNDGRQYLIEQGIKIPSLIGLLPSFRATWYNKANSPLDVQVHHDGHTSVIYDLPKKEDLARVQLIFDAHGLEYIARTVRTAHHFERHLLHLVTGEESVSKDQDLHHVRIPREVRQLTHHSLWQTMDATDRETLLEEIKTMVELCAPDRCQEFPKEYEQRKRFG